MNAQPNDETAENVCLLWLLLLRLGLALSKVDQLGAGDTSGGVMGEMGFMSVSLKVLRTESLRR
ncbi:hypothetical protein OG265_36870 (plasmid) [Streptomyces sp. NBC_01208]|uniref:hypothetical protein n=1 Tax=Streptomyces sp. NBC_01208 TaxID=2903773 RepID=UPI002E15DCD8|nr:hypothetical protein OG265_36870 [Streptomyces sp. NBC_01208]